MSGSAKNFFMVIILSSRYRSITNDYNPLKFERSVEYGSGESVPIRRVNVCFTTLFFLSSSSLCVFFFISSLVDFDSLVDFRKLQFNQFSVMPTLLLFELWHTRIFFFFMNKIKHFRNILLCIKFILSEFILTLDVITVIIKECAMYAFPYKNERTFIFSRLSISVCLLYIFLNTVWWLPIILLTFSRFLFSFLNLFIAFQSSTHRTPCAKP